MNCKKWNKEIPSDSKFCPYCGENSVEDNSAISMKGNLKKSELMLQQNHGHSRPYYGYLL